MPDLSDLELLAELGVPTEPKKVRARTPREERIVAGFEDIVRFRDEHGRAPGHGEGLDIFERLYAVRLDRLRALPEARELLRDLDARGLLDGGEAPAAADALEDDALLAELGVDIDSGVDITRLVHVAPRAERAAAEEVAGRSACADFDRFKPLFDAVERDLAAGARETRPFGKDAAIELGDFFVLGGQLVYVAEVGEPIRAPNGERDARTRLIYANGTESDLLRRSLQRALYKDEAGRRVTDRSAGPLFGAQADADDTESGTIYVLRSRSDHPYVARHRDVLHKIGVTGGSVEARIRGAANDPTFLFAPVDVVATYHLYNINRAKLETLLHRLFAPARLDVALMDRFNPREWFLVPLPAIDEAVRRIRAGTVDTMRYDSARASLTDVSVP